MLQTDGMGGGYVSVWFSDRSVILARKSTKKKTKRKSAGRLKEFNWPKITRICIVVAVLLHLSGLIWIFQWGIPKLEGYASGQRQVEVVEVQFNDPPAWMNGDLELSLMLKAQSQLSGNPLNREELVTVRQALLSTGWFNDVTQVKRVAQDRVEIDGQFVDPYAVIRDREGDHLIDPFGTLLPRSYTIGAAPQFIAVTGVHFPRPIRPGEAWDGGDITAALRMLRVIDHQAWRQQVIEVDISEYLTDHRVDLITAQGGRIIWGSPPGEEQSLEALADFKLRLLEEQFQRSGFIDAGLPLLDLTRKEGSFTYTPPT